MYRRRLPHLYSLERSIFLTWRLQGSLAANRYFPVASVVDSGKVFVAMDRILDRASTGPSYLREPIIAEMVVDAIQYNAQHLMHYELQAFAVMPNHVHLLVVPTVPLPKLTKSLKGITAKKANLMLGLTGTPFWQDESYDRLVRNRDEFESIRNYIEDNPVRAGLVGARAAYRWSSAWAVS